MKHKSGKAKSKYSQELLIRWFLKNNNPEKTRFKTFGLIVVFSLIMIFSTPCYSTNPEKFHFDGYSLGVTFRQLDTGNFKIVDMPFIDARIPLITDFLKLGYGGHLIWGLTDFFVEWTYSGGIHIYPFRNFVSINTNAHLGSFFFDNITYMGSVGLNIELPLGQDKFVSLGVEYFYRNSRDLFDYISFSNLSKNLSGKSNAKESINIDSRGIGVSIGFRL